MYEIVKMDESMVKMIASSCRRDQFKYHEMRFITDSQLSAFFVNSVIKSMADPDTVALGIYRDSKPAGMISCAKEHFDTEIFGFECYRILELVVFSMDVDETMQVAGRLISAMEAELIKRSDTVYIFTSLNNNLQHVDYLFNAYARNNYYYIHTLLHYYSNNQRYNVPDYYPEENITIRLVNENDAERVAELAEKSFRFSRFIMDPYLDNTKAKQFLRNSAMNSVLHGFVDAMFVAEQDKKILGYYSGKKRYISEFDKTIGEAFSTAVDEQYRRLGIYGKLDSHMMNWYADNTDFAELGTYLGNNGIHKNFANKGNVPLMRGTHQFSKFIKA